MLDKLCAQCAAPTPAERQNRVDVAGAARYGIRRIPAGAQFRLLAESTAVVAMECSLERKEAS